MKYPLTSKYLFFMCLTNVLQSNHFVPIPVDNSYPNRFSFEDY